MIVSIRHQDVVDNLLAEDSLLSASRGELASACFEVLECKAAVAAILFEELFHQRKQ